MLSTTIGILLLLAALGFFALEGFRSGFEKDIVLDDHLAMRGTQSIPKIGLSLFASSMGVWLLFTPAKVAYYGGFFDVMGNSIALMAPFMIIAYLGPLIRRHVPDGVTLGDYVRHRMGRRMQFWIGSLSILCMFAILVAEFAAVGFALELLTGMSSTMAILLIAVTVAVYTSFGGLRASIRTDIWQAWVILGLMTTVLISQLSDIGQLLTDAATFTPVDRFNDWEHGSIAQFTTTSFLSGMTLVIALTATQMFNQGNWQRVHAAEDDEAITKGALLAAALVFPMMFIMGFLGTAVAGAYGPLENPAITFFVLTGEYSTFMLSCIVVLSVALVCSTTDTLLNSTVTTISRDILENQMTLEQTRKATIALMIPVIILALSATNDTPSDSAVILFSQLLATAAVFPLFLTLLDELNADAAMLGIVGGIFCVFLYGFLNPLEGAVGPLYSIFPERIATGIHYILQPTNDSGGANLNVFITALVGSTLLTYITSQMMKDTVDSENEQE